MQIVACFEEHVYLSKHLQKATYLHMSCPFSPFKICGTSESESFTVIKHV